ncbi:NAD-dependent protein deacylase [Zooshikella marina]|uniref:Sir2 family NAD+-dependent deacetylase n=1 Tax=Zooshikella ganghwensis TaxID=202772 RepID=UPI001BAFAE46|nr:Sir2 family NAD+-dependent deacetylase [Zooshikella ganghwensis]MBU2706691.1 NAD-dependent protein deacylase [Zooshikella ganghwensis]
MPSYQSVVVLTGSGISAESGIRTFRASDGLWEEHRIEDVATPDGFRRNPTLVHDFYNARRQKLLSPEITYNAAHKALAAFEQRFSGQYLLVTQNIDDLHERAGSQQVVHMHGELLKSRCEGCGEIFSYLEDLQMTTPCPCCQLSGHLRPHIVWFNEIPLALDAIYSALTSCDLFVAIGTSGNVYPAAGFFQEASHHGAHTVELNLEPSVSGSLFKEQHYGPASEVVPRFFAEIA